MQTYNRQEQYSRRSVSAYREITAAIQRVQQEGRTIIREVPTMPERILTWECRQCGPTIRHDSNRWHKCRLCGQDAVRRTRVRPDIQEKRWRGRETRSWPRRTSSWHGRPAGTINGRA